jgi:hypothetical protein
MMCYSLLYPSQIIGTRLGEVSLKALPMYRQSSAIILHYSHVNRGCPDMFTEVRLNCLSIKMSRHLQSSHSFSHIKFPLYNHTYYIDSKQEKTENIYK